MVKNKIKLKVDHFPSYSNPYISMLLAALRAEGVEACAFRHHARLLWGSLTSSSELLHLHWIHPGRRAPLLSAFSFWSLLLAVSLYKIRRKKVFWTVHNLSDHENKSPRLDRLAAKFVARVADQIVVHGRSACSTVSDSLNISENKISVMLHGNYAPVVGETLDKENARQMLGLEMGAKIALMFGQLRPYKGVAELLKVFKQVDADARLIIAGRATDESYKKKLQALAVQDSRIQLRFGFIEQDELSALLRACDFVVLPFKDVFTSGSLLYSLTHSRPVVIPRLGLVEDYVDESCAYLYNNSDVDGLRSALISAFGDSDLDSKYEAAARCAAKYEWSNSARELAGFYYKTLKVK